MLEDTSTTIRAGKRTGSTTRMFWHEICNVPDLIVHNYPAIRGFVVGGNLSCGDRGLHDG